MPEPDRHADLRADVIPGGVSTVMSRCVPRGRECGVARDLLDRLEGFGVCFVQKGGGSIRERAVFQGNSGAEVQRLLDSLQSHYDAHPEEVREMLRRRRTRL